MFLVCGDTLFDFFLDGDNGPGEARFDARAGGSPFNVAIGLGRLGEDVGMLTAISRDMLGERLRLVLAREKVRDDYVVPTERLTTISLVGLDSHGSAAYAFHHSADTGLRTEDLPVLGAEVTGLHFGSYSIAAEPVATAHAWLAGHAGDRFISLDPNIRPTVVPDMKTWDRRVAGLAARADLIKISAEDVAVLYPGRDHTDMARSWLAGGAGLVVVTDGGGPARAWTSTGLTGTATPPATRVVDTVGAGDTFQACLIAELNRLGNPKSAVRQLTQDQLDRILHFAAAAASITCSRRGADLPTRAEVEARLKG
jgi:fructokinase